MQTYLVTMFTEKELKELLDDLYMDDTVDMLEKVPGKPCKANSGYRQRVRP